VSRIAGQNLRVNPPRHRPDDAPSPAPHPLHLRSLWLAALALVGVLWLHLISALLAGLGGFVLYRWIRDKARAHTEATSRGATLVLVSLALVLLAAILFEAFELLLNASSGGLSKLLQLMADTLDQIRATAPQWLADKLPDSAAAMQEAISGWLRSHAGMIQHWGRQALHLLVDIIVGLAIGLMAATSSANSQQPGSAVIRLAQGRLRQLALAFSDVVAAQLRISAINTLVTAVYLLAVLPALGYHVPLAMTLVAFCFFSSLMPIVGNLLSNATIILASLTVSPWLGAVSLGFLVVVHKLEYFLNARIVGGRIQVPAYALLASMLVLEAAFGMAGLVAAPVYCAWLSRELRGWRWI
jgi:predicted PurR-regulated permease PerM